jgi:hypothetical protein
MTRLLLKFSEVLIGARATPYQTRQLRPPLSALLDDHQD